MIFIKKFYFIVILSSLLVSCGLIGGNNKEDISENASTKNQALKKKLLESGIMPDDFDIPLRGIKSEVNLFREENLPLQTKDSKLSKEYDAIIF